MEIFPFNFKITNNNQLPSIALLSNLYAEKIYHKGLIIEEKYHKCFDEEMQEYCEVLATIQYAYDLKNKKLITTINWNITDPVDPNNLILQEIRTRKMSDEEITWLIYKQTIINTKTIIAPTKRIL